MKLRNTILIVLVFIFIVMVFQLFSCSSNCSKHPQKSNQEIDKNDNHEAVDKSDPGPKNDLKIKCTSYYPEKSPYNVEECLTEARIDQMGNFDSQGCSNGYYYVNNLLKNKEITSQLTPMTEKELEKTLKKLKSEKTPTFEEPVPNETLQKGIIESLNLGFLLDSLNENRLKVTSIKTETFSSYKREELLFEPFYGQSSIPYHRFQAIYFSPTKQKSFPTIIVFPGHANNAQEFFDHHDLKDQLLSFGYDLLVITPQAICQIAEGWSLKQRGLDEHTTSKNLLLSGFSFPAIRSIEALLLRKYILYKNPDSKIGFLGHSTGSCVGNHTTRMVAFDAFVSDEYADYLGGMSYLHDVVAPRLFPWAFTIINQGIGTSPKDPAPITPTIRVTYSYKNAEVNHWSKIRNHFDHYLK